MTNLFTSVLFLTLFYVGNLPAQCPTPTNIPDSITSNIKKLTLELTKKASKDYDKACLLFNWVCTNINYDSEAYKRGKKRVNATTTDVLRRGEAVCLGYAQLYAEMCQAAGLNAMVVDGHSKQGNKTPDMEKADHAWNAVQVDGHWLLADVTWASGNNDEKYLFLAPEDFIKEHLPADPMWQLLEFPVTPEQFQRGVFSVQQPDNLFNFSDSITAFLAFPAATQKVKSAENIFRFNPTKTNRELLGQAYVDYALSMNDKAEYFQKNRMVDSLSKLQHTMIHYFRLAAKQTELRDWQKDNFANVLINQAVNISGKLTKKPSFPEAQKILQNMKELLLEAKKMLKEGSSPNFPTQTFQVCIEYLKWVEGYWK